MGKALGTRLGGGVAHPLHPPPRSAPKYNYTETVPIGKANHHLFYLFMRTIKLSRPCQN